MRLLRRAISTQLGWGRPQGGRGERLSHPLEAHVGPADDCFREYPADARGLFGFHEQADPKLSASTSERVERGGDDVFHQLRNIQPRCSEARAGSAAGGDRATTVRGRQQTEWGERRGANSQPRHATEGISHMGAHVFATEARTY